MKLKEKYSEFETINLGRVVGGTGQEPDITKKPPPEPEPEPSPWWVFWE